MKNNQAALKAWETIRLNKALGLKGKMTFTKQKVEKYLAQHSPTDFVKGIMLNAEKPVKEISKIVKSSPVQVERFLVHCIESVVLGRPKVGKPLELTPLIKYLKYKR